MNLGIMSKMIKRIVTNKNENQFVPDEWIVNTKTRQIGRFQRQDGDVVQMVIDSQTIMCDVKHVTHFGDGHSGTFCEVRQYDYNGNVIGYRLALIESETTSFDSLLKSYRAWVHNPFTTCNVLTTVYAHQIAVFYEPTLAEAVQ